MPNVGYTRKPKTQRTPPVWRAEAPSFLQDNLIDTYLHFKDYDYGYTSPEVTVAPWRKVFQMSVSVHVKPGKAVTLIVQEHSIHWNRKAEKPFITDDTIAVRTVYLTSKNRPAYYFYNVTYNEYGKSTKINLSPIDNLDTQFQYFTQTLDMVEALRMWRNIAESELGPVGMETVYPGVAHFGRRGFNLLGFHTMRCTTAMDATIQIFGKKCYRKDLVRAVGNKMQNVSQRNRADILAWVALFKRMVPIDWLVLAINRPHHDINLTDEAVADWLSAAEIRDFRDMIAHLKPNERRNILLNTHGTIHGYLLSDTIASYRILRNYGGLPDDRRNVKDLRQLHDLIIAENNRITRERQRLYMFERYAPQQMFITKHDDVEQFALMLELDPRMDIRIARDYETLSGWSDYMVNCISSYFTTQALLGGIYEDGILVANFELQAQKGLHPKGSPEGTLINARFVGSTETDPYITWHYELNQLLGKRNQKLDAAKKEHIEHVLSGYGIHLKSGRWA